MTKLPTPFWHYIALTSYPNGEAIRGKIRAHSLNGALSAIHQKGLFAISIALSDLKNGRLIQSLVITQAVIDRLRREGVETTLQAEGKLVVMPIRRK